MFNTYQMFFNPSCYYQQHSNHQKKSFGDKGQSISSSQTLREKHFKTSIKQKVKAESNRNFNRAEFSEVNTAVMKKKPQSQKTVNPESAGFFDEQFYGELISSDKESKLAENDKETKSYERSLSDIFVNFSNFQSIHSKDKHNDSNDAKIDNPHTNWNWMDEQYFAPYQSSGQLEKKSRIFEKNSSVRQEPNILTELSNENKNMYHPESDKKLRKESTNEKISRIAIVAGQSDLNYFDKLLFSRTESINNSMNSEFTSMQDTVANKHRTDVKMPTKQPDVFKAHKEAAVVHLKPQHQYYEANESGNNKPIRSSEHQESVIKPWKKGLTTLRRLVPDWTVEPSYSLIDQLVSDIAYEDESILCLNKPFRLACQGGPGIHHSVTKYLPEISSRIKHNGPLYLCQRLDKDCTGILLLAKHRDVMLDLKKRIALNELKKTYLTVTRNVPNPEKGSISIPVALDVPIKRTYRTVLVTESTTSKQSNVFNAITEYSVVKKSDFAALVELQPITGYKHQIRVHLSDGLGTPILGDHKYSHKDRLVPQKVPHHILSKFGLTQGKARHIPLHLHTRQLTLPNYNGKELKIQAKLPDYFRRTIRILKLK